MRTEFLASLFGTGFSLWNAGEVRSESKPPVSQSKQTFFLARRVPQQIGMTEEP